MAVKFYFVGVISVSEVLDEHKHLRGVFEVTWV